MVGSYWQVRLLRYNGGGVGWYPTPFTTVPSACVRWRSELRGSAKMEARAEIATLSKGPRYGYPDCPSETWARGVDGGNKVVNRTGTRGGYHKKTPITDFERGNHHV